MAGEIDPGRPIPGEHIVFNVIYNHLPLENVHAVHKGNVSVIWTRLPLDNAQLCLYLDAYSYTGIRGNFDILLLNEPIVVQPGQYDPDVWKHFDHIITQYDAFIRSGSNFTKNISPRTGFRITDATPESAITEDPKEREQIYPIEGRINGICMINGNKQSTVPGELYSRRIEAALWFATHSPVPFDVYGTPPFFLPNYKGIVPRGKRLETMKKYRFAIAFENVGHDIFALGYVDKILDCLETRTVPVYLGAPNIKDYIPEGCYIDFRKFRSFEDLDEHIRHMKDEEYLEHVRNIDLYVTKGGLRPYSWHTIYNHLISLFARQTGHAEGEICDEPSSPWAPGICPAYAAQEIREHNSSPFWTFADGASRRSPLIDYENAPPRPGGSLPHRERYERILKLQEEGDYRAAIEEFAYMAGGGNIDLHYLFATLLLETRQFDSARVHLELILSANGRHSRALNDLGATHLIGGDIKKAVDLFHKAIACDNRNYDAVENLVRVLVRLNMSGHAASVMSDLTKALPEDTRLRAIAEIYGIDVTGTGTADAIVPATGKMEMRHLYDAVVKIAGLRNEGKYDEALRELEPLLAARDEDADLHYLRSQVLNARGDTDQAAAELEKTIGLDGRYSKAHNDLGCYHAGRGENGKAFDSFTAAISLDPANHGATANLITFLLNRKSAGEEIEAVRTVKKVFFDGIRDIGTPLLPEGSKRALVIHRDEAIPWYLSGMLDHFPYLTRENMWWESGEMVRILNLRGYIVDYVDPGNGEALDRIDWDKYQLVIDGGMDNIARFKTREGQKKVLYASGEYWLNTAMNELSRVMRFALRNGIIMPAALQCRNSFSDETAQYLAYFGKDSQLKGYNGAWKGIPLDASTCLGPRERKKDLARARGNYVWLGAGGMLNKGLDLVVEAFARIPEATLHVFAPLEEEMRFFEWFKAFTGNCPNIVRHAFDSVASGELEETAWNSIGTVYAGSVEGAPGFLAQLLHYGLIPIVTRASCVREEELGHVIEAGDDREIIEGIIEQVGKMETASREELEAGSRRAREFALMHHTREAFTRSFENLLAQVEG